MLSIQATLNRWSDQSPAQLAAMTLDRLPAWVSILAVLLLGYYLAKLVWLLYPVAESPPWLPPAMLQSTSPVAVGQSDYASIGAAHLFGELSRDVPAISSDAALTAPDTGLSLQLRATVTADDPKFAHAIIADSSGGEKVYFAEMPLPGGAVLQKIQPDLVILSRSGQLEVLRLPRAAGGASAAPSAASSAPRFPAVQAEVEEFVAQNTAGFLEVVRPQPFMPNGQLKGYRIYPGPNRQQFAALGLRAGDLITEINGVVLNNPAQGTEVFRSLGDATQVTVTLERDGQPQVMSLNLSQVSPAGGATQ
ncbi:MAG: type II secretion system protein GspC [Chromatiales bacterium]|jgi:general secretion pathway protein C|nr:type II secretion system protein GspC [Chromatiales bacterium]